jgi:hypothetical protein
MTVFDKTMLMTAMRSMAVLILATRAAAFQIAVIEAPPIPLLTGELSST